MKSLLLALSLLPVLALGAVPTSSIDIGRVAASGSTSLTNGVYTVRASGADIWGARDEFRFVHGSLSGDGEVVARVDSLSAPNSWTKAGVMIRETLAPSSRYAYALISGGNGSAFQYRRSTGGSAASSGQANRAARAPYWVRIRRAGNTFTAYISTDGRSWRQQGGSISISMGANVYAGIALTSHRDGVLATAAFSSVSLGGSGTTPSPSPTNSPPVISGAPSTAVTVGAQYAFTPTATDADGDSLTYSITNRPSWATFSASNGRLAGTPTSSHIGSYSNVVIRVSDGKATAQLPAFTIVVSNVANRAPVISGTPPTQVMQGTGYSFQPAASDADGDPLTFSIANAPPWASFSSSTGRLQGTPTAADVGTYGNIVIRVSDGKTTTALPAFGVTVLAVASGSATLSWTPPTTNTDGSPLTNLAGYRVYWGPAAGNYTSSVTLSNAGLTAYVVSSLAPGRYYFVVTALSSTGVESTFSNVASKLIP